jgi:succinoglycan biosynthesis protein ExoL
MSQLIIITPTSTQPRFRKRIESFLQENKKVKVFSFKRKHQIINDFGEKFSVEYLAEIEDGKYFKRLYKLFVSFLKLRKNISKEADIYVFGLDLAFFGVLFLKNRNLILEIGDIRKSNNTLINYLSAQIESFVFKNINQLVVTSPGFKNYYSARYPDIAITIKLNKIYREYLPFYELRSNLKLKDKNKNKITIGIIGLLRYKTILQVLDRYANSEQFDFLVIGDGALVDEIINIKANNIYYYGAFKNPDDLNIIYTAIDFNFVVYNSKDINVQLALPNKLYESIYFNIPIIVSKDTFLWKEVEKNCIGICVDDSSDEINFNFENSLTIENLKRFKYNISRIENNNIIE